MHTYRVLEEGAGTQKYSNFSSKKLETFFATVFNTFSWLIMVSTISLVAIFVRAYVKGNF